jgi:hypothetical protein
MPDRSYSQLVRTAAAALAGVLLLAGCASTPEHTTTAAPPRDQATTTETRDPQRGPTPPATPAPAADGSPVQAAKQWLVAYRSADWTDTPSTWIDRVRPYVTDAMNTANNTLRNNTAGTDWATFVHNQCTSTVTDVDAVIPPESPGTDAIANVQVTGTITTTCRTGQAATPIEPTAATLVVVRQGDGTWRVDQRIY